MNFFISTKRISVKVWRKDSDPGLATVLALASSIEAKDKRSPETILCI